MSKKRIQLIIVVLFSLYGIIALFVSFPFSPFLNTQIPLRGLFPSNYRMFVKPVKMYSTLELVYFNKGEADSIKVSYSEELLQKMKDDFPFNANLYYYYKTLLFSSHKLDYFNNMSQYIKQHPEVKLDNRKWTVYKKEERRISYYKRGLYNLSEKIKKENKALHKYHHVIIRLKAHNILPKYDNAYYKKNEYVYSLPEVRTIIALEK